MADSPAVFLDVAQQTTKNTGPAPGEDDKCPLCGGDVIAGYGMAGGGMGVYFMCDDDACQYFHKRQDRDE